MLVFISEKKRSKKKHKNGGYQFYFGGFVIRKFMDL